MKQSVYICSLVR